MRLAGCLLDRRPRGAAADRSPPPGGGTVACGQDNPGRDQRAEADGAESAEPPPPPTPQQPKPVRAASRSRSRTRSAQNQPEQPPPPTQPPRAAASAPPPSTLTMRPSAPVDLNLHGLGGIVVNNGPVHGGEGGAAGTFGDEHAAQAVEAARRRGRSDTRQARRREGGALSAQARGATATTTRVRRSRRRSRWTGACRSTSTRSATSRDCRAASISPIMAMRAQEAGSVSLRKREVHGATPSKLRGELTAQARASRCSSRRWRRCPSTSIGCGAIPTRRRTSGAARSIAMWRETAGSDDEVGAAGRKARATIEAFIRERLPAGSEDAYTDDELRRSTRARAR